VFALLNVSGSDVPTYTVPVITDRVEFNTVEYIEGATKLKSSVTAASEDPRRLIKSDETEDNIVAFCNALMHWPFNSFAAAISSKLFEQDFPE